MIQDKDLLVADYPLARRRTNQLVQVPSNGQGAAAHAKLLAKIECLLNS